MWFTETAWPPIFVCIGAAVLLWAWWFSSGRGFALVGAGGMLVVCGVLYGVERLIVTEGERVEQAVHDLAHAYQRQDIEGTLELISDDAPRLESLAQRSMNYGRVEDDLRITDLSVKVNAAQTEAVSHFRVNATVVSTADNYRTPQPFRFEMTWRREDGQWRAMDVVSLDVVTGEPNTLLNRFQTR